MKYVGKGIKAGVDAARAAKAQIAPDKFDYMFGRVGSNPHNAARSGQNVSQLSRIGVYDDQAGRALLQEHFDGVVGDGSNILRTFSNQNGDFQVRESLLAGPGGFVKFESTWQVSDGGLRMTTAIPMRK